MKTKKWEALFAVALIMLFMTSNRIYSQTTQPASAETSPVADLNPRDAYSAAESPEENYLARFKAIEVAEKFVRENLENIFILKIIVTNFPEQGWKADYDKIYSQYKRGVSLFYRRDVVYSRIELEKNRNSINELYSKIADTYKKQCDELLEKASGKIFDYSLDERNQLDGNRSRILYNNMIRLWVSYGQSDDAKKKQIRKQGKPAVLHLRIAKSYAILILEDLDPDNSKGKYDVFKADNLNRIADGK